MDLAALILSLVSFLMSGVALTWQLVKHFSTHTIQYIDPLAAMTKNGKAADPFEQYREIGDPKADLQDDN